MAAGGETVTNFSTVVMRERIASTTSPPDSSVRNCYSLDVSPFGFRHRRRISRESLNRRRTLKDVIFKIFSKSEKFRKSSAVHSKNYQIEIDGDEHAVVSDIKHLKSRKWKNFSKTVRLTINNAKSIPREIQHCRYLVYFYLQCSDVRELPLELCILENIRELHLSCNNIQRLTYIEHCRNLRLLDVSRNKLLDLEKDICELKQLNTLNLNGNQLKTLPMEIGRLHNLQNLFISANKLCSIPSGIKNMRTMQNLDLSRNKIDLIDENFFENLLYLECVVLSDNQLSRVPDSIEKCSSLKSLYLRKNQFKFIPPSLSNVENLESLNIADNYIRKYNVGIKSLKKLYLGSNELSDLGDSIAVNENLVSLSIDHNSFETFPLNVLRLSKLRNLNLSFNPKLSEIPNEINDLKNLRHLNLEATRASCISGKFVLRNQLRLSVAGSLFSSQFQEMSEAGIEALQDFIASKNYQLPDLSDDVNEDNGADNTETEFLDDEKVKEDDGEASESEYVNDQYHDNVRCRQFSILKLS